MKFNQSLCPEDSNGPISEETIKTLAKSGELRRFVFEPKYDGSRYLLHLYYKGHHLTSRRKSVKTKQYMDRIDNVPHFKKLKIEGGTWNTTLHGTVLDGEVVSRSLALDGEGGVGGILNSKPEKAIETQKEFGKLRYMIFGIKRFCGKDVSNEPLRKRRKLIKRVLESLYEFNSYKIRKYIRLTPQAKADTWKQSVRLYKKALRNGLEGVMIKDMEQIDGKGVYKWKVYRDTCVIVTGFVPGTNKYKELIGSLKVSVIDKKNQLKEIGECSGMTDKQRREWTKKWKKFNGTIIEVRAQRLGAKGRLRHPRFIRIRDDYPRSKCTLEKIEKDLTLI